MNEPERVAIALRERAVTTLLVQHPLAAFAAMRPDGWLCETPPGLSADGHPTLVGGNLLELVVPADRAATIASWARVRAHGVAQCAVRLLQDPQRVRVLQFADLRETYAVFVVFVLDDAPDAVTFGDQSTRAVRPRYCQMRRNELSYVIAADEASFEMFGWSEPELVGAKSLDLIHPDDHERAIDNWLELLGRPGGASRWRGRYRNADGSWKWVEITNHNRLADPDSGDVLTEFLDIDDEMAMHETLRAREELFRELTVSLPVGVVQIDRNGNVVFTNPRLGEIVGTDVLTAETIARRIVPNHWVTLQRAILTALRSGGVHDDLEIELLPLEGRSSVTCQISLRPLRSGDGAVTGAIASVSDITERVNFRNELQIRVSLDDLTSCHNRASTLRHLRQLLGSKKRVAVLFFDLDGFKSVNDEHGHVVGDELLRTVASRLRGAVRSDDIVGRLGGDEFVVLQPEGNAPLPVEELSHRLQEAVEGPAELRGISVTIRASVGAVLAHEGDDPEQVIAAADSLMYSAKRVRTSGLSIVHEPRGLARTQSA